jgi:hypothetical protein
MPSMSAIATGAPAIHQATPSGAPAVTAIGSVTRRRPAPSANLGLDLRGAP